jgi:hypothetical protein
MLNALDKLSSRLSSLRKKEKVHAISDIERPIKIYNRIINRTFTCNNNCTIDDINNFLYKILSYIQSFLTLSQSYLSRTAINIENFEYLERTLRIFINEMGRYFENNSITKNKLIAYISTVDIIINLVSYINILLYNIKIYNTDTTSLINGIDSKLLLIQLRDILNSIKMNNLKLDNISISYHHYWSESGETKFDSINNFNDYLIQLDPTFFADIEKSNDELINYISTKIIELKRINDSLPLITNGGSKSNYKKTENKITVIYKKKKYTRVIYINERKKYVKINKAFMLLSKLKKI